MHPEWTDRRTDRQTANLIIASFTMRRWQQQTYQGWERKMRENSEVEAGRADVRGPKGREQGIRCLGRGQQASISTS